MLAYIKTSKKETLIELREVAEPQVADHEALIEIRAISVNRGELGLLTMRPEGWQPGWDIGGVVVKHAANGSGPDIGTRVVGLAEQGGWAQRVAIPTDRLAILPENITFTQAAGLPMAGVTALRTLRFGDFLLGKRVLITGATGGVGRFAVQLAALAGAKVTGVGRPEHATGLRELGASEIVTKIEQAKEPFDLILESVGGDSLTAAFNLIAPHGTIVVYGTSSGEDTPFNLYNLFGHEGVRLQTYFSGDPGISTTISIDLTSLVDLVSAGKLSVPIGLETDWRELSSALTTLQNRQIQGKAVFHVS